MGVGAFVSNCTGAAFGTASGLADEFALEKIAEFTTETALGLLDSIVMERVTKVDDVRAVLENAAQS